MTIDRISSRSPMDIFVHYGTVMGAGSALAGGILHYFWGLDLQPLNLVMPDDLLAQYRYFVKTDPEAMRYVSGFIGMLLYGAVAGGLSILASIYHVRRETKEQS